MQVIVEPILQGKAFYGYSKRVASGNSAVPAVLGTTWIRFRDQSMEPALPARRMCIVLFSLTKTKGTSYSLSLMNGVPSRTIVLSDLSPTPMPSQRSLYPPSMAFVGMTTVNSLLSWLVTNRTSISRLRLACSKVSSEKRPE
jgi:hypothetical protein